MSLCYKTVGHPDTLGLISKGGRAHPINKSNQYDDIFQSIPRLRFHDQPLLVAAVAASCRAPGMESRESALVGHGQLTGTNLNNPWLSGHKGRNQERTTQKKIMCTIAPVHFKLPNFQRQGQTRHQDSHDFSCFLLLCLFPPPFELPQMMSAMPCSGPLWPTMVEKY